MLFATKVRLATVSFNVASFTVGEGDGKGYKKKTLVIHSLSAKRYLGEFKQKR